MATKEERKKAKRDRAAEILRGSGGEPTTAQNTYVIDIINATNWYNANEDKKTLRKYALDYGKIAKINNFAKVFGDAADHELRQIGIIGRLLSREQYVSEEHISTISSQIDRLVNKYNANQAKAKNLVVEDQPKAVAPVVTVKDKIRDAAFKFAEEIDAEIDTFALKKESSFSTKNYLLKNQISGAVAKRIADEYRGLEAELSEAVLGKDDQLKEAYGYLTKTQLKKFHLFVKSIIDDCEQRTVTTKVVRVKKPIPPAKLIARLKYKKEEPTLNIKSVLPVDILGASEVWVYNTKYRKLMVYKGDSLSVKGTTITGYDIATTSAKTLRKPEEFFKDLSIGKRNLNTSFKGVNSKPSVPNGRVNEECVIIGAFK